MVSAAATICPAAKGRVVRHCQIEPEQADDGADQALRLAQGQAEHGPERECGQDCQGRIPGLATRGRARLRPPALDGLTREPDRQAATLAQAGVILTPIHELVLLLGNVVTAVLVQLERQGGLPRSGQGGACYAEPVLGTTWRVRATRSRRQGKVRRAALGVLCGYAPPRAAPLTVRHTTDRDTRNSAAVCA